MDATLRIKNLSIALKALSRIPDSGKLSVGIQTLIEEEMEKQYKENHPIQEWPPRGSARTSTTNTDDIPF